MLLYWCDNQLRNMRTDTSVWKVCDDRDYCTLDYQPRFNKRSAERQHVDNVAVAVFVFLWKI